MRRWRLYVAVLVSLGAGCSAGTPGAQPHDMSVAEHERAASAEEAAAAAHGSQYDPGATTERSRCRPNERADVATQACWTSTLNPTDQHLRQREEHRRHAADHRAASAALREAEARACVGIDADDRDESPFDHAEDIESTAPLEEKVTGAKPAAERTAGAVVTFRAVPGMTAEWLQRVVDCHIARNAALGHQVPEMPNCPLVPDRVEAKVSSSGNGFAVAIRSDDDDSAREVLARASRLGSGAGKP